MPTLIVKTKIGGVLANVTSVTLADPTGTFGVCQGTAGAVVVPAGTPMARTATGTYEYSFTEAATGVDYTYWAEVLYAGETHHFEYTYHALVEAVTAELGPFDDILISNVGVELAMFGEPVIVYPPGGAARSVTGIVTRKAMAVQSDPRQQMAVLTVQLPNSATTGISGAEWSNRFELGVPRYAGGPAVRMRTVRAVQQDAAMITWEVL